MGETVDTPRRRSTDQVDDFCISKCRREDRIERAEKDVHDIYNVKLPELWTAHNKMVAWVITGASSAILCLISILASIVIPQLMRQGA